jgi:hypothetical protein
MSEITGPAKVHEAYAFVCIRCGYGWEQSYEIEHHHDGSGREFIVYKADGVRVPSPLAGLTCPNCERNVVRIMRAGQVSSVHDLMEQPTTRPVPPAGPPAQSEQPDQPDQPEQSAKSEQHEPSEPHHWHLSDLFHRK